MHNRNGLRHFSIATLALAMLSGCASSPPVPRIDDDLVKQFAGRGYLSDDRFGVSTSFATWRIQDQPLDVALAVPTGKGPVPLVVYLPALGESRAAGATWRTAWAQAGFAVLSCQLRPQDSQAWSSPRARAGDFTTLAKESYSGAVMTQRLTTLDHVIAEVRRRAAAGEAPYDRIDTSRLALAGYDLGAYTSLVAAGENLRGLADPRPPLPAFQAVIAISPYADFGGLPFPSRYDGVHVPVLSVTSEEDGDALGLVTSPYLRRAPFEHMPPGDKLLLTLSGLPHQGLGGNGTVAPPNAEHRDGRNGEGHETSGRRGGEGGGGGGQGRQRGGRHGGGMPAGGGDGGRMPPQGGGISLTRQALEASAVQGVSTAFLDAYLRQDATAQEWLRKDAPRWLGDKGRLERR